MGETFLPTVVPKSDQKIYSKKTCQNVTRSSSSIKDRIQHQIIFPNRFDLYNGQQRFCVKCDSGTQLLLWNWSASYFLDLSQERSVGNLD